MSTFKGFFVSLFFLVILFVLLSTQLVKAVDVFVFNRNLQTGNIGEDVKELQKFLNTNGFIISKSGAGSPGKETTKFGALTRQTLIKFQKANKIIPAVGYFGPVTRKIVNKQIASLTNEKIPSSSTGSIISNDPKTSNQNNTQSNVGIDNNNVNSNYYSISGSITGIVGPVILQNNNRDSIVINVGSVSNFTFPTKLASGSVYSITATTNYPNQKCYISKNIGVVSNFNINDIKIACGTKLSQDPFKFVFTNNGVVSYDLSYTASANGTLAGTSIQTINRGQNGTSVTAVPDTGYYFVNWSDASTSNPRTDTNVTGNISVTANFALNSLTITTESEPLTVNEESTNNLRLKLSNQPASDIVLNITKQSGDTNLTLTSGNPQQITFTTANWDTYQNVNISAASDLDIANGSAIIRISKDSGTNSVATKDVTINELDNDTLQIETDLSSVNISEGGVETFQVRLNVQPDVETIVTVARTSGDTDISVTGGSSLTFTTLNWNDYQTVTLSAAEDNANTTSDSTTITLSSATTPNTTVTATEIDDDVTLTVNAGANGTTDPTGAVIIEKNAVTNITATNDSNYHFTSWTGNTGGVADVNDESTTITTNVGVTVQANFAINTFTITASAGANGIVSPTGVTTKDYGSNQEYTITPSANYYVLDVLVDDVSVGAVTSYTFTNIQTSHTISATFAIDTYALTIPASAGTGTGSYGGTSAGTIDYNTAVSITATPDASSNFTSWTATGAASGCNGGAVSPCVFNMTGIASVQANYTLKTYTLTYSAVANGSIVGTNPQTVSYGSNGTEVTATPIANYHFVSWSDAVVTAARTDTNITADKTVSATFAIDTHTVTFNSNGGSAVSAIAGVDFNSTVTLPTPPTRTGYNFAGWFSDDSTFLVPFTAVTAVIDNIIVYAKWIPIQPTPTFSPDSGAITLGVTPITITSVGADIIYYTTDGSTPTTGSATIASGNTITLASVANPIKAYAVRTGYTDSAVGTSGAYSQAATADLTNIALSGSPTNFTFAGATYTYGSVAVLNAVSSITVTPTGSGTITVNGTPVTSGQASGAINLSAGTPATITVVATETGKSAKTYTITVTRNNSAQTTPTFSPVAGAIAFGTTVTISSAGADTIYYTTNGDTPTTASTNQAVTPCVINSAVTVKALAVRAGYDNSAVGSAAYTQAAATVPSSIVLAVGTVNPVGGVTNVAIPAAGATDTTGAVTGWTASTADKIKFTVTDNGGSSTITINGSAYTSGANYTIAAASTLTIVVTTVETGKVTGVRTFTVTVAAAFVCGTNVTFTYNGGSVTYGTVSNPTTGKCWLDRNLGATRVALSSSDSSAYGDLIQWGRPIDGHQLRNSGTQSSQVATITPGTNVFIILYTDWSSIDSDGALRSAYFAKTDGTGICPTGFRVPTETEINAERLSWSSNNAAGAFASLLKLTVGGARVNTDGSLNGVGVYGGYWSSSVNGLMSQSLYAGSSSASVGGNNRARGFSVRCIRN